MRLADQFLLAQIRERLLSHIPDDQWRLVEEEVDKAGGVREVEGYTGVLLKDAISKASFGGDRSAAGRYAANQRWQGQGKSGSGGEGKKTMQARAVVSGEPASPSREQQKEYNKFVELNDRRRSLERDIEYTESNLNRVINEQLGRGAGQEAQMQQDQDVIDRAEKVLSNLKVKRDAIQAQIEKEFPTPSPQSEPRYGGRTPREGARLTESEKAELPSRDLSYLANTIISDLKTQGKSAPSAAAPYLQAMRTMESINENYGMDTGASIVGYLLSNLASYKGETAKIIKAELRSRLKNQRLSDMAPNPNASLGRITATDMYGREQETSN